MTKSINNFLRKLITVIFFTLLIIILIFGIGIVDNYNKQAQDNPFLNTFFIDFNNYILCFRYLGLQGRFSFNLFDYFLPIISFAKPLIISFLILFTKIKSFFIAIF